MCFGRRVVLRLFRCCNFVFRTLLLLLPFRALFLFLLLQRVFLFLFLFFFFSFYLALSTLSALFFLAFFCCPWGGRACLLCIRTKKEKKDSLQKALSLFFSLTPQTHGRERDSSNSQRRRSRKINGRRRRKRRNKKKECTLLAQHLQQQEHGPAKATRKKGRRPQNEGCCVRVALAAATLAETLLLLPLYIYILFSSSFPSSKARDEKKPCRPLASKRGRVFSLSFLSLARSKGYDSLASSSERRGESTFASLEARLSSSSFPNEQGLECKTS